MMRFSRFSRASAVPSRRLSQVVQPPASPIWKAGHAASPVIVPVSEPFFPAVPSVADGVAPASATMKMSTLNNGIRVASEDDQGFLTSLGLFASAGPRFVGSDFAALPHFFQKAALMATARNSHFKVVRDLERLGVQANVEVSRDVISINMKTLNHLAPYTLSYIADALKPRLMNHDLNEITHAVELEMEKLGHNTGAVLTDAIHSAAYGGVGLGNPSIVPAHLVHGVTADDVRHYIDSTFTGSNIVIAAHGISHDILLEEAKAQFEGVAKTQRQNAASAYTGGEVRLPPHAESPHTHFAVGFNAVSWTHDDIFALCVLNTILGGGDSFSAGGPGKGMKSLFFTNILNTSSNVESALAQSHIYNDSGIFVLQGATESDQVFPTITKMASILKGVRDNLSDGDFHRGISQSSSSILFNLEDPSVVCEDIGRQILAYNRRTSAAELSARINSVKKSDITRVINNMLAQPLSFATLGRAPVSLDKIRSVFGQ